MTYKCGYCQIGGFSEISVLFKHLKNLHSEVVSTRVKCGQAGCNNYYSNFCTLRKHLKTSHSLGEIEFRAVETAVVIQADSLSEPVIVEKETYDIAHNIVNSCTKSDPVLTICCKLDAVMNLPRSATTQFIKHTSEFLHSHIVTKLKDEVKAISSNPLKTEELFSKFQKIFDPVKTEKRRFALMRASGCLIEAYPVIVGRIMKSRRRKRLKRVALGLTVDLKRNEHSGKSASQTNVVAYVVPLERVLKKFLELPHVFDTLLQSLSPENNITNLFVNSELWHNLKSLFGEDKTVFPLFVYQDDFEVGNALGSHKGKHRLGGVYASIPCLPPECSSLLQNIFLCQIYHTSSLKRFGIKAVFQNLIKKLNELQEKGITVTINGQEKRIYFIFSALLGDNLGINPLLGFAEGFSANNYCRFCRDTKEVCRVLTLENSKTLRDEENYELDLHNKANGVQNECVFHEIKSFNLTNNLSVDIMHDLLLGICRVELPLIIKSMIKKNMFSLRELNRQIYYFDFGSHNIPPEITVKMLKKAMLISASEMLSLVIFLPAIVGSLVKNMKPCKREWDLFILLREIVDICTNCNIQTEVHFLLRDLVVDHHNLFLELFPEQRLRPKFHNLVHYPTVMKKVGPLANLSCMRFEGKHQSLKKCANATTSRKNIIYTIALKEQLSLCSRFLEDKCLKPDLTWGKISCEDEGSSSELQPYSLVSFAQFGGMKITPNLTILVGINYEIPQFGIIKKIYVNVIEKKIKIVYLKLETILYNDIFCSYLVERRDFSILFCNYLPGLIIVDKLTINQKEYVLKWNE